jgi:alanyl-tRNA synthetase
VEGFVNVSRRLALRNHHTATHVLSAACRKVLGPHVWQQGAKKTELQAHLDITHFRALTYAEEVCRIEGQRERGKGGLMAGAG